MAQQTINIGTIANDGTGDTLRDGGDKINDNFTELYAGLTGLLDFKGSTDASANPNYPAASKGDYYLVSVAGKIGGASGIVVQAGDSYFALADNAGGTQAGVGTSWTVVQGNLIVDNDTTLAGDSTSAVPTQHAVKTYADAMMPKAGGTFTGDIVVPAEAYDATGWNGSNEAPTKNDVRDKIEAIIAGGGSFTAASTTEVLTGTDNAKGATPDSLAALWEQGSDVASSGTISIGEGGYFNITGTTGITDIDFGTDRAGRKAWVKFAGVLTITHNASTLILPTGANITTAAGDTACFVSEGSDAVRCVSYNRASGAALTGSGGATQYERTRVIPVASNFTLDNAGTASITDTTYGLKLSVPSATSNLRFVRSNTAPPGTPYSVIVRTAPLSPYDNANLQWPSLVARNSTSGRIVFYAAYNSGQHAVQRWSAYSTFSANALAPITAFNLLWLPWHRMRNDGTNLYFGRSPDGEAWFEFHTEPLATYINASGGTLDQIGFGLITVSAGITAEAIFQSYSVV